jgi:putative SOS response-associated peptidase YedK
MCGRFTSQISPELLTGLFGLAEPPTIAPRYNIAPTQQVPVIRQYADGQNHLDFLRWGLIPTWSKEKSSSNLMINARSETVSEKPAFKQSVRYRRCVVVASGFYEWKHYGEGNAAMVHPAEGQITHGIRRNLGYMEVARRGGGRVLCHTYNDVKPPSGWCS